MTDQNRRQFLKNAVTGGACAALAGLIGAPLLSCTKASDLNSSSNGGVSSGVTPGISYDASTKKITLDLTKTAPSVLATNNKLLVIDSIGSTTVNVMAIRISDTVRAFNAQCPHANSTRHWSYSDGTFTCSNHGRSFSTSGLKAEYTTAIDSENANLVHITYPG